MRAVAALFSTCLLLASPAILADTLNMPEAQDSQEVELDASQMGPSVVTPGKGASMQAVVHRFGQPVKKYRAVGGASRHQPPITRWDYPDFYVFFEHTHVVRAVIPGRPPKIQRTDGLRPAG